MSSGADRVLIANADDFGLSDGVNEGIVRAFRHGIVRSTSLMVRMPAAEAAAALAHKHPDLSIGLHLDMGEWKLENGEWVPVYQRVPMEHAALLEQETRAQLAMFERLMGRPPSHVDSHQHTHTREPLRSIVSGIVAPAGIPLRHVTATSRYCGDFYGQDTDGATIDGRISAEFLKALVAGLPEGATELCCHPAAYVDFAGMYREERIRELEVLCDAGVIAAIEDAGIKLRSHGASVKGQASAR
jgi:chitin disaccharide deacetylase